LASGKHGAVGMSEFAVAPPHDSYAEQAVLGSMLRSAAATEVALGMLVGADFYEPRHQTIFDTIAVLADAREPTDTTAVHSRLLDTQLLESAGGSLYLFDLIEKAVAGDVAYYAAQVADKAQRRALMSAAGRIFQAVQNDGTSSAEELTSWAAEQQAAVAVGTGDAKVNDALTPDDLLAEPPKSDWVIPDLMERADRLVLTGSEGLGKSTLNRQLAVMAAAGIHPFDHERRFEPARVMVVDCENGQRLSMRRYAPLLRTAREQGELRHWRLYLEPGGLDLAARGGSGWLLRRVEREQPDLLVIGPLYRLHMGDPNDERDARRVAAVLDRAREVCGSALIVEAHSPHGQQGKTRSVRPVGSSLWLRWPEFGYGLARTEEEADAPFRVCEVRAWRGPRDERAWPKRVRAGGSSTVWPWVSDEESPWY
jgi:replicative DNA helicase